MLLKVPYLGQLWFERLDKSHPVVDCFLGCNQQEYYIYAFRFSIIYTPQATLNKLRDAIQAGGNLQDDRPRDTGTSNLYTFSRGISRPRTNNNEGHRDKDRDGTE